MTTTATNINKDRNSRLIQAQLGQQLRFPQSSVASPGDRVQSRAYFRSLRAAEMAAWELTGGDYVISGRFNETADEPLAA